MNNIKDLNDIDFNLFYQSLDVYVLLDLETSRFIKCNESVYNMYGYTKEEFLTLTPYDLSVEFLTPEMMEHKQEDILVKGFDNFVTKHKTKYGEILNVFVRSRKLNIKENQILFITLINLNQEIELEKFYKKKFTAKETSFIKIQDKYLWDKTTSTLLEDNKVINLSMKERKLLKILIKNINNSVSKEHIYKYFDFEITYDSLLSMIKRIRKKTSFNFIKSIYSSGYKINSKN